MTSGRGPARGPGRRRCRGWRCRCRSPCGRAGGRRCRRGGRPRAIGPPRGLRTAGSNSGHSATQPSTWAAKASLSSSTSRSAKLRPALASARFTASTGASPKYCGSVAETPVAETRASGSRPVARRPSSSTRSRAAAPSLSGEAFPAVTVPPPASGRGDPHLASLVFRKDGLSLAIASRDASGRTHSSAAKSTGSPLRRGTGTAAISTSNRPSARARAALWCEARAYSSCCSRVIPCLSAISSADSPSGIVHCGSIAGLTMRQPRVVEYISVCPAGKGRSGLGSTYGARVIDSTPPASATDASPTAMARAAWTTASRPDAHSRFTVTPGTVVGRPASSAAMRATLRFSSPAPLALPKYTSSIRDGSRSGVRPRSSRIACAARSSGRTVARPPLYLPNGVRTASTM